MTKPPLRRRAAQREDVRTRSTPRGPLAAARPRAGRPHACTSATVASVADVPMPLKRQQPPGTLVRAYGSPSGPSGVRLCVRAVRLGIPRSSTRVLVSGPLKQRDGAALRVHSAPVLDRHCSPMDLPRLVPKHASAFRSASITIRRGVRVWSKSWYYTCSLSSLLGIQSCRCLTVMYHHFTAEMSLCGHDPSLRAFTSTCCRTCSSQQRSLAPSAGSTISPSLQLRTTPTMNAQDVPDAAPPCSIHFIHTVVMCLMLSCSPTADMIRTDLARLHGRAAHRPRLSCFGVLGHHKCLH